VSKIYVNDIGRTISVSVGEDLTGATVTLIKVLKPNGEQPDWVGTIQSPPSNGILTYTTVDGDLDCHGAWFVQGYMEKGSRKVRGETATFTVYRRWK
jgi:hypothetical protein